MADYRGYVTAAGQNFEALAKQFNYPVTIGFVEIGDGKLPDNESPIARTRLVNKLKEFPAIVERDAKNPGQWVVTCNIPADDAINGAGYFIREMGCKLIDQGAGVLYSYRRVSDDWKPVITSGEAKSVTYKLRFIPNNGELLTPTIDPSVVLVDREELDRALQAKSTEFDKKLSDHEKGREHPAATTIALGLMRWASGDEAISGEAIDAAMSAKDVSDAVKHTLKMIFIGIPLPWMKAEPPAWALNAAGQAINPTTDPILASRYPSGVVPDHRGMTLRGWDNGRGVDIGRALLSYQQDQIQQITGRLSAPGGVYQFLGESITAEGVFAHNGNNKSSAIPDASANSGPSELTFDSARVVRSGTETTVKSLAYNIIMMRDNW